MLAAAEGRTTKVEEKTQEVWTELQTHLGLEPSHQIITGAASPGFSRYRSRSRRSQPHS